MAIRVLATKEEIERIFKKLPPLRRVVLCQDCSCKKAVAIGRVMAWRCPYSTVDVDLNGFCHRGMRMDE